MSILIDLFGSILLAALLSATVAQMNDHLLSRTQQSSSGLVTAAAAGSVVYALKHDLRKAGYGVSGNPFTLADSTRIRFQGDVDADGDIDTLFYYVGPVAEATDTVNPRDRYLYRVVNGGPVVGSSVGITTWRFTYFDTTGAASGAPVDLSLIRKVRVEARFESLFPYAAAYSQSQVHFAVRPLNLEL